MRIQVGPWRNLLTLFYCFVDLSSLWGKWKRTSPLNSFFRGGSRPWAPVATNCHHTTHWWLQVQCLSPLPCQSQFPRWLLCSSQSQHSRWPPGHSQSKHSKWPPCQSRLASSLADPTLRSVRAAGIARLQAVKVLEVVPLSAVLPVMAVAMLCVWAVHCTLTPETSPVKVSSPKPSPVQESITEPSPVQVYGPKPSPI